jgi:hypothetical protein
MDRRESAVEGYLGSWGRECFEMPQMVIEDMKLRVSIFDLMLEFLLREKSSAINTLATRT